LTLFGFESDLAFMDKLRVKTEVCHDRAQISARSTGLC
jgi:hypothetical protein